jgi:hypothetical protein
MPSLPCARKTLSEAGTKGALGLLLMNTFDVHRRDWRALLERIRLLRLGLKRHRVLDSPSCCTSHHRYLNKVAVWRRTPIEAREHCNGLRSR